MAHVIPYALILHLVVSIWAYSEDNIFDATTDSSTIGSFVSDKTSWSGTLQARFNKTNILPLLLALLALIVYLLAASFLQGATHFTRWFLACLTCFNMGQGKEILGELNVIDVSYQRAVDRGLIKGLATYNILQNPKYKQAFAITESFARRHTHVESIRGTAATQQFQDDGEGDNDGRASAEDIEAPPPLGEEAPRSPRKSMSPNSLPSQRMSISPSSPHPQPRMSLSPGQGDGPVLLTLSPNQGGRSPRR